MSNFSARCIRQTQTSVEAYMHLAISETFSHLFLLRQNVNATYCYRAPVWNSTRGQSGETRLRYQNAPSIPPDGTGKVVNLKL